MEKLILEFLKNDVGTVVVSDGEGNFISGIKESGLSEKAVKLWQKIAPSSRVGQRGELWELYDGENKKYYRITTSSVSSGSKIIQISFMLDVTEYTSVFRNISCISADWEESSKFQTSLIKKISGGYDIILPDIAKIFRCTGVILYTSSHMGTFKMTYKCGTFKKCAVNKNDPAFEKRKKR